MNTWNIQQNILDSAAKLEKESHNQYHLIRQEMVTAAGTLRSIAAQLRGKAPAEALAYLRRQRALLDKQQELFAWTKLGNVIWEVDMAAFDEQLASLRDQMLQPI